MWISRLQAQPLVDASPLAPSLQSDTDSVRPARLNGIRTGFDSESDKKNHRTETTVFSGREAILKRTQIACPAGSQEWPAKHSKKPGHQGN
jgi:hypothetical protein